MSKGKFVVLSLAAVALIAWGVGTVNSGIVDGTNSTASAAAATILACPQGDGDQLSAKGGTISVTVKDNTNAPIPGIPAADFWLIGSTNSLALCGGSGSSNADSASNAAGQTTISGAVAAGGCDTGVKVVVQGVVINTVVPVAVVSPDMDGSGSVVLADFSVFGGNFNQTVPPADACADFTADGAVNLADFAAFGSHWQHAC